MGGASLVSDHLLQTTLTAFKKSDFSSVREHEEFVWLHDRFVENEDYAGILVCAINLYHRCTNLNTMCVCLCVTCVYMYIRGGILTLLDDYGSMLPSGGPLCRFPHPRPNQTLMSLDPS